MTLMDEMKLVELYGEYKRDRVCECNRDLYSRVVDTIKKEMPRIVDPGAACDYIDHIADMMRWPIDDSVIWEDVIDFLAFFG